MSVGKGDISCVLMNSKHKRLAGFREITGHLFDPLPWLEFVERVYAVRRGMILRLRNITCEGERQEKSHTNSTG